jgi:hypothetical protein
MRYVNDHVMCLSSYQSIIGMIEHEDKAVREGNFFVAFISEEAVQRERTFMSEELTLKATRDR